MATDRSPESIKALSLFIVVVTVCLGASAALAVLVRYAFVMAPAPLKSGESQVTPIELITTLLTGLTVSIAILALVIAALAIWGYHTIKTEARKIAGAAARRAAVETVKSPEIQKILKAEARAVIESQSAERSEGEGLAAAQPPPAATMKTETESERVGKPRPKGKEGKNGDAK